MIGTCEQPKAGYWGTLKMIQLNGIASVGTTCDSEKDVALAMVSDVAQEIDPVVAKRVLRKIDLYFMPAMLIG